MEKLTTIKNRIYADYFMPSRLEEYEKVIIALIKHGYRHITLRDYAQRLSENRLEGKYFINRHDIDTDIKTAKQFFEIEQKHHVVASYYFRTSTLDIAFMKQIEAYGSEASYHFEEIATFAKKHHIKSKEAIKQRLPEIRKVFKKNFLNIEKQLGSKLLTVCSHGDFVNRKLGLTNNILIDNELRKELGIVCETYDRHIMNGFDIYISDKPYPRFYSPDSIFHYINKAQVICMLSHPRQWRSDIVVNTADNLRRLYEGLAW